MTFLDYKFITPYSDKIVHITHDLTLWLENSTVILYNEHDLTSLHYYTTDLSAQSWQNITTPYVDR